MLSDATLLQEPEQLMQLSERIIELELAKAKHARYDGLIFAGQHYCLDTLPFQLPPLKALPTPKPQPKAPTSAKLRTQRQLIRHLVAGEGRHNRIMINNFIQRENRRHEEII